MKEVIFTEAALAPKRDKSGNPIPNEFCGRFRRKLKTPAPGAFLYEGVIAAQNNKPYKYWAQEASILRGYIRWVDVQVDKFGTRLVMFLENDRFVFRVQLKYDVMTLRGLVNQISNADNGIEDWFANVTYNAWIDKDKDGKPKLTDAGNVRWATAINFEDARLLIEKDKMREYLEKQGLAWEKRFNSKTNKDEFDPGKEMAFWMKVIRKTQERLLMSGKALPFNYNSVFIGNNPHPSGCGLLNQEAQEQAKDLYQKIRGSYKMPFAQETIDGDDAFSFGESELEPPSIHPVDQNTKSQHAQSVAAGKTATQHEDPYEFPAAPPSGKPEDIGVGDAPPSADDLPF